MHEKHDIGTMLLSLEKKTDADCFTFLFSFAKR